jgi:hypothetical protein
MTFNTGFWSASFDLTPDYANLGCSVLTYTQESYVKLFKVFSSDGDTEQIKKMTSISKTDSKSLAVVVAFLEVVCSVSGQYALLELWK